MLQWRFANARADSANKKISNSTEINAVSAWDAVSNLPRSIFSEKITDGERKNGDEDDLDPAFSTLESWGEMERQHLTAMSMTKQCLHSAVCRIPLVGGAKMDTQSTVMELRRAFPISSENSSFTIGTENCHCRRKSGVGGML